jgi:serine/threonine protein kinase
MGNCCGSESNADVSTGSALGNGLGKRQSESIHAGLLRLRNIDVYKKYETIEVLGQGSMGYVSKVRVKSGEEGGSAFKPASRKNIKNAPTLSERRSIKVDYALKQIQLDKVSIMFIEELHNEIDILKGMVRVFTFFFF